MTKHRNIEDARRILRKAKDVANGQKPDFIVTDRLPAYGQAVTSEFYTNTRSRTAHVRLKNLREGTNNNVERLNGTVRERTEVVRGLDRDETAQVMMDANRIYYNYLRPHQALNGKTPAEKAGIDLKLKSNKWEELIRQAQRTPKVIKEKKDV